MRKRKPTTFQTDAIAADMYRDAAKHLGLPTYHEMLDKLHDEIGIPGCGSFWDCLRYLKDRLDLREEYEAEQNERASR